MTVFPPGFVPDRVLTMSVQFSGPRYREDHGTAGVHRQS